MSGSDEFDLIEEEWDEDFRPTRGQKWSVAAADRIAEDPVGRAVAVDRGRVTVLLDDEVLEAAYAGSMRRRKVAVGDHVRVRPPRHETDGARITDRLERTSVLHRTSDDAIDQARVVAANVDQAIVVVSGDHLDAGARFVDRVAVAAEHGDVLPVVCINKLDVADPDEVAAVREVYEAIGYEVLATSARTGEGVDTLRWRLEGVWTVLTGHSGVGKSSLYNLLVPEAAQAVAAVGRRGGRHTTVASRAERVPGLTDAWLVDTPGVRSFGLGHLDERDLASAFPELRGLGCELQDCRHDGEPGCALVEDDVAPGRLAAYRRLRSSLLGDDAWERDEWAGGDDADET